MAIRLALLGAGFAALIAGCDFSSSLTTSAPPLYAFKMKSIDGNEVPLKSFHNQALLIVNTASKCGLTNQYEALEGLYEKYKDYGFSVLAFPSNEFGQQEPGSDDEIKQFCKKNYGVTFPLFSKIAVKGERIHPLYAYLTQEVENEQLRGDIRWNFDKFLVNRDGKVIARFEPRVAPDSPELVSQLEAALGYEPGPPIYGFTMKTISGVEKPLKAYRNQTLLIVNTASNCGLTPQYEGLEALYNKYKDHGFSVLGFPSNEFGQQEPGSDEEIKEFCKKNYGVTFPLFSKIAVKGEQIHPLYAYLTQKVENEQLRGDIRWNFDKFLVNRDGKVIARFAPRAQPDDKQLVVQIEEALGYESEAPIYGFTMKTIGGEEAPLETYRNQALLIVNTASKCGLTPQYEGLEALYNKYKDQGFSVLAFPSNEFGQQEPGSDEEIKQFCKKNYGVTFPLFSKIAVKGEQIHPLYAYLTQKVENEALRGDIRWNFDKFLVNRDGEVIARFAPRAKPNSPKLVAQLEAVLADGTEEKPEPTETQ